MPKLTVKSDGSIAYEYNDSIPEEAAKKQKARRIKDIKDSVEGKDFKSLTPADKEALLELLLRRHGLI